MSFSRFHPGLRGRFAFLGFELYWNRERRGDLQVMKRTARKKLRQAKKRIKLWIRWYFYKRVLVAKASTNEEPGTGKLNAGVNAGVPGNGCSYRERCH